MKTILAVSSLVLLSAALVMFSGTPERRAPATAAPPTQPVSERTARRGLPEVRPQQPAGENPFNLVRKSEPAVEENRDRVTAGPPMAAAFLSSRPDGETPPPLSGFVAATATTANDSHSRMLAVLQQVAAENRYEQLAFGSQPVSAREHRLELSSQDAGAKFRELLAVAEHRLWRGDTREAIAHLQSAQTILQTASGSVRLAVSAGLHAQLGLAFLRLGENENCVDCNNAASCLLPISNAGVHSQPEGSTAAMDHLRRALTLNPSDITSRWLLNVAAMTLGTYPNAVPDRWRVDPACFESEAPFPQFTNVAATAGVNISSLSGGSVADDFDGDGDLDLIVSSWDAREPLQFYRNVHGHFVDDSTAANFSGIYGGLNMLQADYDNDGDLDLLVLRGAWLEQAGCVPNSLLANDGSGRFTDVTFRVGLATPSHPTQTARWLDYDNDGDLDLFVGNEHAPCQLFENLDGERFQNVATNAGIAINAFVKGVAVGDYDQDGFSDIYVSVLGGANVLLHNNGDGTFTDVAAQLGVQKPHNAFPTWFWDANQDGHLDLFVSSYSVTLEGIAERFFGKPNDKPFTMLYEGDGRGGFREVSADRNLQNRLPPMGANFGDLNNDGYPEIYLGTGAPAYQALMPNVMLLNDGGHRFLDVTSAGGFGHLQKGHGISFADYDNDGDQDVFAEMGGAYPGDRAVNCLFQNPGFDNHWITIHLVGHRSNRSAIGARVAATVREGKGERTIYHWVGSGGSFGCNPLRCEIGLGAAETITRLEVHWPASQTTQVFHDVTVDQFLRIDEDTDVLKPLTLSSPAT